MKRIFFVFAILTTSISLSQSYKYSIEGVLKSKSDNTFLEAATIHLEKIKDSSVVTYTISDSKGKFKLEGKTFYKELRLIISFVGYKTFTKKVVFDKKNHQLGKILLENNSNLLEEVIIKSNAPITIKKDTLEFNVKSFKTKKDANVEDLLKKLPGIEINDEGKITVNGKPVNKILVNGKPFFGNDPTITTKNLSKDIIEKVQITDTKTKSEAFTGEKGDNENKTINLTIKKENNKGVFGRLAVGKGTDNLYEFAGIVNRFNGDRRFSVLGGGNNINSPGFSFGEINRMFGGNSFNVSSNGSFSVVGLGFGGESGVTTSQNFGATYADKYGKSVDVNGDYFYSNSDNENVTNRNRETILPNGGSFLTNSNTVSRSSNKNQNINFDLDVEIDSTFLINIKPSFTLNKRQSFNNHFEESSDENNNLINRSTSNSFNDSEAKNFRNRMDFTKRLNKKGSFLKLNIINQIDQTKGSNRFNSDVEIFGANPSQESRNQIGNETTNFNSFRTNFTYRHSILPKKLFLDFQYSFRNEKRENERNTFDIDNNNQQSFNTDLSTDFTFKNMRSTPSVEVNYKGEKWSSSIELGSVTRTLENNDVLRPMQSLKRTFNALEVRSRFNYRFNKKSSIYTGYSLRNSPPNLSQLQPFTDISNPLNLITGNPNLKPSNNNRIYLGYNNFNFQKGTGIYGYFSGSIIDNQVISKSTIDENLIRNTTFENVNGNYDVYGSLSYSKKFKLDTLKTIRVKLSSSISQNKSVNFLNDVKYNSVNTDFGPSLEVSFDWKNILNITPRYTINQTTTKFNINQFTNQNFTRHNLRIRARASVPKNIEWNNTINYQYNPNVADGFQKSSWFWNSSISYSILKDKGIISLKAYDLLNQNTNARRNANANFIEDTESTVLTQYFMLSFSWKFNNMGAKGKSPKNSFMFF